MNVLIIEPYSTKSHKMWMKGLAHCLPFNTKTLSLPPRHWKWRMHGAAITLSQQVKALNWLPDCIILSEMMDISVFVALVKNDIGPCPVITYFHENQLTYPYSALDQDGARQFDNHYPFINYTSALASDHIVFNSNFHRESFLNALTPFLKDFPDFHKTLPTDELWSKSSVIYPGIDTTALDRARIHVSNKIPIILWNHRWEYDKNPELFFQTLFSLKDQNIAFQLCVLGQSFSEMPKIFAKAEEILSDEIICFGFEANEGTYYEWLWKADIVVSTSNQEFFGISVVEAMYCGCLPILPDRLVYPEHIPDELSSTCLYNSSAELLVKLSRMIENIDHLKTVKDSLADRMADYDLVQCAVKYVQIIGELTGGNGSK